MKISYISLRKKLKEFKENKKAKENIEKENSKKEKIQKADVEIDDTKYIGINYTKKTEKKESKLKNIFNNMKSVPKGSYTLLLFMILLLVATTKLNIDTYSKLGQEDYETYTGEEIAKAVSNDNVVIYQEAVSSIFDIAEEEEIAVETTSDNIVEANKDALEDEVYVYEYAFIRPVKGDIMKEYSMDKVIYSKTLDMWKVHDGIDIYGTLGEEVVASEKGIVERVYEDSFYGYSVIIDHQNGIKTIYRNLDSNIPVKENQDIEKGETIGKVGNTASGECKDETHIHFEVVKNGEIVSPNTIGIK